MIPKIKTIVYATGLGTGAPYVFRYALSLAREYNAKIDIVCGLAPLSTNVKGVANIYLGNEASEEFHRQARDRVKREIEKQVEAMCRSAVIDDPGSMQYVNSTNVIEDEPDLAVLRCAKNVNADVIVMGTHRRTMEVGALLGSCAVKVLHRATVPVFLVRIPDGYKDLPSKNWTPEMVSF